MNTRATLAILAGLTLSASAGTLGYRNEVLADAPIAYWEMDEAGGATTALDSAGTPQNGTISNVGLGHASAFANLGTCGLFNTGNSRIMMPLDTAFDLGTGDFSVEMWCKTNDTTRIDAFNYKNASDFGIFLNQAAPGSIGGWHNGQLPGYTATTGSWYHIVYARGAGTIRLYVNGVERSSAPDTQSFSSAAQMIIGSNHGGAPGYVGNTWYNGWIDETAVYGSALSAARVLAHYNAAQFTPGAPVIANGSASTITTSGAQLSGTITTQGTNTPNVTIYYGDNDGGVSAAAWDNNLPLGAQSAGFSGTATGLPAGTVCYFRCYAQNTTGGSWAPATATFTTLVGIPTLTNGTPADVLAKAATLGAAITSTGGAAPTVKLHYGTTDGGTTEAAWQFSPVGVTTGSTSSVYISNLTPATKYYYRASATNSAGTGWAATTGSFTTPTPILPSVQNITPTGVTANWATLRANLSFGGFDFATLQVSWGTTDGGTNPAAWTATTPLPLGAKVVAGLTPATTYYVRASATNSAGTAWAPSTISFTTPATIQPAPVINEIHCDNEDKTLREDFIELYNPGTTALNLTGWSIEGGVSYTFDIATPASIPPGGYLVIAEEPAALSSRFGAAISIGTNTFGAWLGSLKSTGETITLRNPSGSVADEVDYGMGFPWPTIGVAPNYSMELIHPSLDNSLGGNWRSKGSTITGVDPELTLVAPASTAWRMRRGCFTAPALGWPTAGYTEDSFWENATTTVSTTAGNYFGIGYGDNDDATSLAAPFPATPPGIVAMQNGYRSLYLRQTFNVDASEIRGNLKLRVYADDAAIIYLNSFPVPERFSVGAGNPGHNGAGVTVTGFEAAPNNWRELIIPNMAAWIYPGSNLIAVHGLNETLSSSDFSLNVELRRTPGTAGASPTPVAVNSVFSTTVPPAIRQVDHRPLLPVAGQENMLPGQDVVITAKATDPEGVQSVSLLYQIVEPGAYITKESAAYELPANWVALPMSDNGTAPDALAGDNVYTAVIPASVQTHRRLIRYRIQAEDFPGNLVRVPYQDDPAPNFAYFVYGNVPDYTAAINPSGLPSYTGGVIASHTATPVTYPGSMLSALPTYQLITTRQNHVDAQYIPGPPNATNPTVQYRGDENVSATDEQAYPWLGSMVYDGKVYDHIRFRARGGVWRYSMGKNMWKFDMARGHDFESRDNFGKLRSEKWKKINFSSGIQQGDFLSRGEHALYEAAGFRLFQLTGMPANNTNYVHFRVIEDTQETGPSSSQYDDDFQGLYLAIEQQDGQMLKEHGLPDGNLYKMEGGTGELNNQGPTQPKNKSDLNAFLTYSNQESWWRQNLQLPNYYNYRAIMDCIHHYDTGDGKNYFFYHYPVDSTHPDSNKWQAVVWDLDLTWADNMYRSDTGIAGLAPSANTTEPFFSRVYPITPLQTEMRNRHREILDLLWNQEQTGMVIDEMASFIYQPGQPSAVGADRAMWDYNPIMVSSFVNSSKAGRGRYYQSGVDDPSTTGVNEALTFPGMMQKMRNYITTRRTAITSRILLDESAIPATPVISRAGGAVTIPTNDLTFSTTAYTSPSSSGFTRMQWRLAEITDPTAPGYNRWDHTTPRKYEVDPDNTWLSPEITTFSGNYTFPAAAARPGTTCRVRVRYADSGDAANNNTPRWSHWSAPVTFTASEPDVTVFLNSLVVSEIMYNPREPLGAELNTSLDKDDFEFIILQNAGTTTLDLSNVRFTKGVDFDFAGSAVTSLPPGGRVAVVKNTGAFQIRYAAKLAGIPIAGTWAAADNLSNGGEQIKLSFGAGTAIRDFVYDDTAPWPTAADGTGHSLVLIAPWTLPDHSLPENWRISADVDGCPGGYDGLRFAAWKTTNNETGDLTDADKDGISNLLEYALQGNPAAPGISVLPLATVQPWPAPADAPHLILTARVVTTADDVLLQPEMSSELGIWSGAGFTLLSSTPDAATGVTTWQWRTTSPWLDSTRAYVRLRAVLRQ